MAFFHPNFIIKDLLLIDYLSFASFVSLVGKSESVGFISDPLEEVQHRKKFNLSGAPKGALRSLLSGAIWTQERLFRHRKALSAKCRCCGAPFGTLWHRAYGCPRRDEARRHNVSRQLKAAAANIRVLGDAPAELFARGIFPSPESLVPPPRGSGHLRGRLVPEAGVR